MAEELITAYPVAVPEKQKQELPGLDTRLRPGVEYVKQEHWDHHGKPHLRTYKGSEKLRGKYAIVTGGDSGIGRAVALLYAIEGLKGITISYLPQEKEDAKNAAEQITKEGCDVNLIQVDLQREEDCRKVVEGHLSVFERLDILVNNASKQITTDTIEDLDLESVRSVFESNILQMIAVSKFAVPHMKRGAAIINTTSVVAYSGNPRLLDYASTKGAIVSFTRALARQLLPRGIRVNMVAPGPVITALQAASREAEEMEGFGLGTPLHGRAAQPAEIAPSFVFLGSSDSNCMTGQCIHVNSESPKLSDHGVSFLMRYFNVDGVHLGGS
ncbi:hypothetical protein F5141DRAFT_1007240 [Pisolithus sp. B1]|nr:hypothetical protein F5141DRAFT_1007240 [Pisolithus sp. B1]